MASGELLAYFTAQDNLGLEWQYVAFNSGGTTTLQKGDRINADGAGAAAAVVEHIELVSGTWAGGDAAGWLILSNWNGSAWGTPPENVTINADTSLNHLTLITTAPVFCGATPDIKNVSTLQFDAAVNEVSVFQGVLPQVYDGGGITVTCGVSSSTATGDMSWFTCFKAIKDEAGNLSEPAGGTGASGLKTFADVKKNTIVDAAASAGQVQYFTIAHANGAEIDSLAAGDLFYLLLIRDAQDATNDDMAADARLHFIALTET